VLVEKVFDTTASGPTCSCLGRTPCHTRHIRQAIN
jgi:hypothetical protein